MKKLLLLSVVTLILCSFIRTGTTSPPKQYFSDTTKPVVDKHYCVSLTAGQWQQNLNIIYYVAGKLRSTDLPSRDVMFITDSLLAPLQNEIIKQVTPQLPKDSTTHK